MDPLTLGLSLGGMALQAFGAFGASNEAKHQAEISRKVAADESAIQDQKRTQMQLEASRLQLQQFRNMQRLRSQATAAAVNQGAQYGSGLQGGLAQISDQTNSNILGINQNSMIGGNIFNINKDISGLKMQMADSQSAMAEDQAWASLGGAVVKNAGTIGQLGQNAYAGLDNAFSLFKPGSLSGGLTS